MNPPLEARSCLPSEAKAALALLSEQHGSDLENREKLLHRLALLERGQLESEGILVCVDSDRLLGCLLAQSDSPNSALVWPPGIAPFSRQIGEIENALFAALESLAAKKGWTHLTALLEERDSAGAESLRRGGFDQLTELFHLQRDSAAIVSESFDPKLGWVEYRNCDRAAFAKLFTETFQETLDCPEFNSLRDGGSQLDGYRQNARDTAYPELWWSIRDLESGRDVGVVLMADSDEPGLDIAYMGLVPDARGKGLGSQLVHEIIARCSQMRSSVLNVYVDKRNLPALRIYEKNGFRLKRSYRFFLMRRI